jgi:amidase
VNRLHSPANETALDQNDICYWSLREQLAALRSRKVSARELMSAHLQQIRTWNPQVNAIVGQLDDQACLQLAAGADQALAKDGPGALLGLPWAFKDMEPAMGLPWTRGSSVFEHAVADHDSLLVERLRTAGVIPIGKTNVPEFGAGSHTYNAVHGITRNPYDLRMSAGGSSGGAGAAVACGMLPAADGSDLGGSLRNPGNFNNVVGFRPSVGCVPNAPSTLPFLGFLVKGPIARRVEDAALLMSVMAGADERDPACDHTDPRQFAHLTERDFKGVRIAWCPDLGGLPLDPRVRRVLEAQREVFVSMGCRVDEAAPDLTAADEVFLTLRAFRTWSNFAPLLKAKRMHLKMEMIQEIEAGARLSMEQISKAMLRHAELIEGMRKFQNAYEFIVCAVNQVPPFDASWHWPREIDGKPMTHYIEWMQSAYFISSTFHPAISVPAGFTEEGLPVGIQLVGRYREDFKLLQFAKAFEGATEIGLRRPC